MYRQIFNKIAYTVIIRTQVQNDLQRISNERLRTDFNDTSHTFHFKMNESDHSLNDSYWKHVLFKKNIFAPILIYSYI